MKMDYENGSEDSCILDDDAIYRILSDSLEFVTGETFCKQKYV